MKKTCNKLIRDNIPEIILVKGGDPVTRIAGDEEYWLKLKEKLHEEIAEFSEAENMEEMAYILEVAEAICEHKNFDRNKLDRLKTEKVSKSGEGLSFGGGVAKYGAGCLLLPRIVIHNGLLMFFSAGFVTCVYC
ncbi:MAG: hypothetical protein COU08_03485 [Candidatus Harrisonbacteria bacterium CG10_big_fil_rev_8_21_14_0_10_42_17]|uniref:Phosphoribosyl-ATP pyrophosphohydrolase n=1 Tax=Candidatus Harrisonbacteria bacterium CG10_big_fil_rev_8_21_14_0_10_42_17 TaxID=1974584 RepID=A0A2M6WHD6_9BACT|nr:MAG: hypothetical protein COU08_03485 [Candidatus Harrisonbacteria bacterium CG10_big_fil_rev_8_21_14_0_10_42_17]